MDEFAWFLRGKIKGTGTFQKLLLQFPGLYVPWLPGDLKLEQKAGIDAVDHAAFPQNIVTPVNRRQRFAKGKRLEFRNREALRKPIF
jgi:hypothetical protein